MGPLTWGAISVDKKHKARVCLSEDIIFQSRTTEAKLGISLPSNVFALLQANSSQTLSKQWGSERGVFSRRSARKGFHTHTHPFPLPLFFSFPICTPRVKGGLWPTLETKGSYRRDLGVTKLENSSKEFPPQAPLLTALHGREREEQFGSKRLRV